MSRLPWPHSMRKWMSTIPHGQAFAATAFQWKSHAGHSSNSAYLSQSQKAIE